MYWRVVVPLAVALAVTAGAVFIAVDRDNSTSHPAGHAAAPVATRSPVLAALDAAAPPPAKAAVSSALAPVLREFPSGEQVSGTVVDVASGTPLWARAAHRPAAPASTLKLLTAAAALRVLGPGFTFATTVRLVGDTVYLVGGGDPTLAVSASKADVPASYPKPASLTDLAQQTAAALEPPAQRVRVRVDTSMWSGPQLAEGWSAGYVTEGDVTPPSALELDGGRLRPAEFDSPRTPDPAMQAGATFAALLRRDGVSVRGVAKPAVAPQTSEELATVASPPLSSLVQRMLTDSDNDLAEALGRAVALHDHLPPTFAGAADAVRNEVAALGVPAAAVSLHDTSGLSHLDMVQPAALVAVLRSATADPTLRPVIEGLPTAGFTGTLADRYRGKSRSPGAGLVRAKTGSLTGVNSLAGLVVDGSGRLLAFAFMGSGTTQTDAVQTDLDAAASALVALS
ncbi:MAG TPA: D-alanyl-D-alanine carboxypeptidase/D-alanyl-D-alanine-endopeptidase [Mycobacteriales bacterium]|nr:D-alanyl-D-alanine carboxypeptidase/D-alanyl-D-alanine-endopeptidase [Mycobacteriales bacterium]